MRDTETMVYSCQQKVLLKRPAVTVSKRAPTMNPFLTKSKKSDDRHVERKQHKRGRCSYSVGVRATPRAIWNWSLFVPKIGIYSLII